MISIYVVWKLIYTLWLSVHVELSIMILYYPSEWFHSVLCAMYVICLPTCARNHVICVFNNVHTICVCVLMYVCIF